MLLNRYTLLGAGIALILQTSYRFGLPIGIGEIIICICATSSIFSSVRRGNFLDVRHLSGLPLILFFVVVVIITPVTLVSTVMGIPGSSLRDLVAFLFCVITVIIIPKDIYSARLVSISFLCVLIISLLFQYYGGSSYSYYYSRFTGGARNPNQLAMYVCCAILLSIFIVSKLYRMIAILIFLIFGIMTRSDAFIFFLLVAVGSMILFRLLSARIALFAAPFMVSLLFIVIQMPEVQKILSDLWLASDEGSARGALYAHALQAWSDNFLSIIFGFGAGSFSGIDAPFGGAEAHNTALDMLTVAGVFGIALFPIVPIMMAVRSLYSFNSFAPAVLIGLSCFALFHFVGRHPVFWATLTLFSIHGAAGRPPGKRGPL